MTIEEQDFKLVSSVGIDRFDLYGIKIINAKNPEKRREEFVIFGYNMTLPDSIDRIINSRMDGEESEYSVLNYLEKYAEQYKMLKYLHQKTKEE